MELVCVRHGRTAWNNVRRFQGRSDIPLDDEGRAQAQALAVFLAFDDFDRAYASPLSRAQETARAVLAARSGPPLQTDPDLIEMAFGTWEGLTWDEIVAKHPELDDAHETKPRYLTPDGGESFDEVVARVGSFIGRIAADTPERVLVVAHAGVMHALVRVLLREPGDAALNVRFDPASVTRFVGDGSTWCLVSLNASAIEAAAAD